MAIWWLPAIGSVFCLIVGIAAFFDPTMQRLNSAFTPFMLMDAPILAGLAFGAYRRSRSCLVLLAVYKLADTTMMLSDSMPAGANAGTGLAFTVMYIIAAVKAFRYHRIVGDAYRPLPRWITVAGISVVVCGVLFTFIVAFVAQLRLGT